jgi:hypothetical protein
MKRKIFLLPASLLFFVVVIAGCSSIPAITGETHVWRITDTESRAVYFARSLDLHWHGSVGTFLTAEGTSTFTPSQEIKVWTAHIGSSDKWQEPFSVPGTVSTYKGTVSGIAMITSAGVEKPKPQSASGQGFDYATFQDIQSGKRERITKFTADEVMGRDISSSPPVGLDQYTRVDIYYWRTASFGPLSMEDIRNGWAASTSAGQPSQGIDEDGSPYEITGFGGPVSGQYAGKWVVVDGFFYALKDAKGNARFDVLPLNGGGGYVPCDAAQAATRDSISSFKQFERVRVYGRANATGALGRDSKVQHQYQLLMVTKIEKLE